MSDWTSGYVAAANIAYTFGYYTELNPLNVKLAFLNSGLAVPEVGVACELGYGQGLSINIHAAASEAEWWGTDFNPAQAGLAKEMAAASGAKARLYDEAFAAFCARTDLPDFDYIGLHGIWTWISDENRAIVVDFLRRKLKVGGALYISYNTMPGWSTFAPVRDLLSEHAEVMAAPGRGIIGRVDAAIQFAEKLFETNPLFTRVNPSVVERLKNLNPQNRHYLAHEYFNRSWEPIPFSKMAEWLEPAKLGYACSAFTIDHVDAVNLTPEQQTFLNEVPDAMFRETVRDFMVNQQFRRDYWVRGARRLSPLEHVEAARAQRIMLVTERADVPLKVNGALGEATMQEAIYAPILEELADHKPKSLGDIESAVKNKNIALPHIVEAVLVLIGARHVQAVQGEAAVANSRKHTDKLNRYLMNKARGSQEIEFLASPVTGGGIGVPRLTQLFLLAKSQGKKTPADWAASAWDVLAQQGHALLKDGKPLASAEENLAELAVIAKTVAEKRMNILEVLGLD